MDSRTGDPVETLARTLGVDPEPYPVGLHTALDEMGPNPTTEFADALVVEGYARPDNDMNTAWESLGRFREALTDFMVGKNVAFAGGVAVRTYGARRTPTEDYDVLVDADTYKALWKFLEERGFRYLGSHESVDNFLHKEMEFRFDIMVADNPLYREALDQAKTATWRDRALKIVTPGFLAAMKVKAYAERRDGAKRLLDRRDLAGLLQKGAGSDEVRGILQRLRPDLVPVFAEMTTAPPREGR